MSRFPSRTPIALAASSLSTLRALRAGEIFFAPDDGTGERGGSGGGGGEGSEGGRPNASEVLNRFNGDAVRIADKLADVLGDNHKLRRKVDKLEADGAALKERVPAEGALVLNAEQKTEWEALSALGKAGEIKKALDEAKDAPAKITELQGQLGTTQRGILLRDVAQASGFKLAVLEDRDRATLSALPGLSYEIKDVEEDGKKVPRAFVKWKEGEGDSATQKEQALAEFAAAHALWKDFLPALQAEPPAPSGGSWPRQGAGGAGGSAGSRFDAIRERNKKEAEAARERPSASLEQVMGLNPSA